MAEGNEGNCLRKGRETHGGKGGKLVEGRVDNWWRDRGETGGAKSKMREVRGEGGGEEEEKLGYTCNVKICNKTFAKNFGLMHTVMSRLNNFPLL